MNDVASGWTQLFFYPTLAQAAHDRSWIELVLDNWWVVIALACVLLGFVSAFVKQFRKYVSHRNELEFKRDLVERGLTIDEIERIVAAKSSSASKDTA